jgi:hypothetical protein
LAFEPDLTVDDFARRFGDKAHNAQSGDAFAAPAFADDAQSSSRVDLPGNPIDGADQAVLGTELGRQTSYL